MEAATVAGREVSQSMQALAIANDTRIKRAHLKRDIRNGKVDICEVLLAPPEYCGAMRILDLLKALPRVGNSRAEVIVRGICRPTLEIGKMGAYTRGRLADRIAAMF